MKIHHALLAALSLVSASGAQAATVDYLNAGNNLHMGLVGSGQAGTIVDDHNGGSPVNIAQGKLAPDSEITFAFNLTGVSTLGPSLLAEANYNFTQNGTMYSGSTVAQAPGGTTGSPFAFATASIVGNTAIATIENISSTATINFLVELEGFFKSGYSYSYNIAAVPLPASLPLFLAGLMALVAFGKRRNIKQ